MEFDKSRVYTALNADELKVGSKVYYANTLQNLKDLVEHRTGPMGVVKGISDESYSARFFDGISNWYLAYLVPEPEGLKWTDLKLGDKLRKSVFNGCHLAMVTRIDTYQCDKHIELGGEWLSDLDLTEWEKVEE